MPDIFFPTAHIEMGTREIVGGLVLYIYLAYTMMILAHRLHAKDVWMAWLPIANLYLLTRMAHRQWWWVIGFFIPYVNFFVIGLLWSEIAQRFGKNPWIGAAMVLPVIGIAVPGYLVISRPDYARTHSHHHP